MDESNTQGPEGHRMSLSQIMAQQDDQVALPQFIILDLGSTSPGMLFLQSITTQLA
jgi:hypothetical protein